MAMDMVVDMMVDIVMDIVMDMRVDMMMDIVMVTLVMSDEIWHHLMTGKWLRFVTKSFCNTFSLFCLLKNQMHHELVAKRRHFVIIT